MTAAPGPLERLAGQLTDEERAELTAGSGPWRTTSIDRLGIPAIKMTDGMVGARGDRFTGTTSTLFPCGPALGSSWDPSLLRQVGRALAWEARAKGAGILLAPVLNLHRHPLAGRNFESFGEDPLHVARMGVAYVEGLQSEGIAAVAKHFVANDAEVDRERVEVRVDERTLREVYLVPFEAAVRDAGIWMVMAAYPRLNGTYCGENPWLLTEILRDEWGFDGVVVSDWGGTHPSSLLAGMDLEMPGPPRHNGRRLVSVLPPGARVLRTSTKRVLRLLDRAARSADPNALERSDADPAVDAVALKAAEQGIVLLTNDGLLPLVRASLRRVAVVGPGGESTPVQGGGSAFVNPRHRVDVLSGLRAALPGVEIVHEPGADVSKHAPLFQAGTIRTPDGRPGMHVVYLHAPDHALVDEEVTPASSLLWIGSPVALPMGEVIVHARGRFTTAADGVHTFGLMSAGHATVRLDGRVLLDSADAPMGGEVFFGRGTQEITAAVELVAGIEHELEVEIIPRVEGSETLGYLLGCWPPVDPERITRAAAAAREADVAVVVVGTTSEWETEGGDREDLALPGDQDELVRAVAAANPRTVVVLTCGGPLLTPWIDEVAACLVAWFDGQDAGTAVARILLGDVAPSGRLPVTFPADRSQVPDLGFDGRVIHYHEGLAIGHRRYERDGLVAGFPFGHGLNYTTFTLGTPAIASDNDGIHVEVPVRNNGSREGVEVVQVYMREEDSDEPRRLVGFDRLSLYAGAAGTARIRIGPRELRRWDAGSRGWRIPDARRELAIGTSATRIHAVVLA